MLRWFVLLLGLRCGAAFNVAPPFGDVSGRNSLACRHASHNKAHKEQPRGRFLYSASSWLEDSAPKHVRVAAATALLFLSTNAITVLPASAFEQIVSSQQNAPLLVAAAEPRDIDDSAKKTLQEAFDALREGNIPEAEVITTIGIETVHAKISFFLISYQN